jgi:thymidylate synthase
MVISLWNPDQLSEMVLPPCVYSYQFWVAENKLSCKITQRSSDIALAGFWNISSGALLTHMLAKTCGYDVGELIWSPADIHIYKNHVDKVNMQLGRKPFPFPKLLLDMPENRDITKFEWCDVRLLGYKCHPGIKFVMNE